MQFYYLAITALVILFLSTEHVVKSGVLSAVAAVLIIALETFASQYRFADGGDDRVYR